MYSVYVLRCGDGSLYVGHSQGVDARVRAHAEGTAIVHTRGRGPVVLVYQEHHTTELAAVARERQLKRWTHAKKAALVDGDRAALKKLSQSTATRRRDGTARERASR